MDSAHKILFIIVGLGVIAFCIGATCIPKPSPALITDADDNPNSMRLGDSTAPATDNVVGPSYLTANVPMMYPPPLAAMVPVTSDTLGG